MDSEYLKMHVGVALSDGLTEIVHKRPVDPIEYLAFWLRKFVENRDFDIKKKEEEAALGVERKEAEDERLRQLKMFQEAEAIKLQEAEEKAAEEDAVVDTAPRPMPPEVSGSLPPVAEGDETEEEKQLDGDAIKSGDTSKADTETISKEGESKSNEDDSEKGLATVSEEAENSEDTKDKEKIEKSEGPKVEDLNIEDPKIEDPKVEDSNTEDQKIEDPKTEGPNTEDPNTEGRNTEESKEKSEDQTEKSEEQTNEKPDTGNQVDDSEEKPDDTTDTAQTDENTADQEGDGETAQEPKEEGKE